MAAEEAGRLWRRFGKRVADAAIAMLALIVAAPLLALIALWVRLDSPGPALFRQARIGRDRVPFRILKFRTMVDRPAEGIDQRREAVLAGGADARVTRAGRILRATSLDELPQLWNVLRGEMSLVGPRPLLPEQLEAVPPEFEPRFSVRPGITGLAQVRGRRSLSWLDQLAADVEYADRHGLARDLGIVLRTVVVVLTGQGVYPGQAQNWREYLDAQRRGDREE